MRLFFQIPKAAVWVFAWLCVADETVFHCIVQESLELLSLSSAGVTRCEWRTQQQLLSFALSLLFILKQSLLVDLVDEAATPAGLLICL